MNLIEKLADQIKETQNATKIAGTPLADTQTNFHNQLVIMEALSALLEEILCSFCEGRGHVPENASDLLPKYEICPLCKGSGRKYR